MINDKTISAEEMVKKAEKEKQQVLKEIEDIRATKKTFVGALNISDCRANYNKIYRNC